MLFHLLAAASAVHPPLQWADLGLNEGINLRFFTLRWYSLAYITGILLAYWHTTKIIKLPGAPLAHRHADDLFFWCTMGIILGGRLGFVLFYGHQLLAHPLDLFKLWEGGMSFHGGLIGVTLAFYLVSRKEKLSFLRVADYVSVSVPFGMFFGRLANFVNGELWGKVAGPDVPWAMIFPKAHDGFARHPSQLYEAGLEGLLMLVVMMLLFWKTSARFRPGLLMGAFALGMALCRFSVEFFREPDVQLHELAVRTGLSMGQWLTLPLLIGGLVFVVRALRRPPLGI